MAEGSRDSAAVDTASKEGSRFWKMTEELVALIGPTTLLTALLYYFGYVSARSFYAYFGVSLSALDVSPQSYLINSADTLFRPIATLLVVLISLFIMHGLVSLILGLAGQKWGRVVALCLLVLSVALAAVGFWGLFRASGGMAPPLSLAAGAVLLEYSIWVALRYGALPPPIEAAVRRGANLRRGFVLALILVSLFWAVTIVAYSRGIERARLIEQSLPLQAQAVVYSDKELQLPSAAIGVTTLSGNGSAYRFRYNGLRPLLYSRDRWFLLPVDWTHDGGATVLVLRDDDSSRIRVDLAP